MSGHREGSLTCSCIIRRRERHDGGGGDNDEVTDVFRINVQL